MGGGSGPGSTAGLPGVAEDQERQLAQTASLTLAPNPSVGNVWLRFGAPAPMGRHVKIDLYDVRGRLVRCLHRGPNDGYINTLEFGVHQGSQLPYPPGIYFVRFYLDGKAMATRKLVLVR